MKDIRKIDVQYYFDKWISAVFDYPVSKIEFARFPSRFVISYSLQREKERMRDKKNIKKPIILNKVLWKKNVILEEVPLQFYLYNFSALL